MDLLEEKNEKNKEESIKLIKKYNDELILMKEKELNSEKEIKEERRKIEQFQKENSSIREQIVELEKNKNKLKKENNENVELLKKLENEKEKNNDVIKISQKYILIMNEESTAARKREDELNINIKKARKKIKKLNEDAGFELAIFRKEINRLTAERINMEGRLKIDRINVERNFEVFKNETADSNKNYQRVIEELENHLLEIGETEKI